MSVIPRRFVWMAQQCCIDIQRSQIQHEEFQVSCCLEWRRVQYWACSCGFGSMVAMYHHISLGHVLQKYLGNTVSLIFIFFVFVGWVLSWCSYWLFRPLPDFLWLHITKSLVPQCNTMGPRQSLVCGSHTADLSACSPFLLYFSKTSYFTCQH